MNSSLRACVHCGVAFTGTRRALYCSAACRQRANVQRHPEQRAYQPQRYVRVVHAPQACTQCGQVFTPRNSRGRYCSGACRYRAFQQRHHT
jgi:ferredoxin